MGSEIGAILDLKCAPVAHAYVVVVNLLSLLGPVVDSKHKGIPIAENEVKEQVMAKCLEESVVVPRHEQVDGLS